MYSSSLASNYHLNTSKESPSSSCDNKQLIHCSGITSCCHSTTAKHSSCNHTCNFKNQPSVPPSIVEHPNTTPPTVMHYTSSAYQHALPGSSIYFQNDQTPMKRLPSFQSLLFNLSLDSQGFPESLPSINTSILNGISPQNDIGGACVHFSRGDITYSNKDLECKSSSSISFECCDKCNHNETPPLSSSSTSSTNMYTNLATCFSDHANDLPLHVSTTSTFIHAQPSPQQHHVILNNRNNVNNNSGKVKKCNKSFKFSPYAKIEKDISLSSIDSSSGIESDTCKIVKNVKKSKKSGVWKEEEHTQFLRGLEEVGENWKLISEQYVKTRSRRQVASHAQKFLGKTL